MAKDQIEAVLRLVEGDEILEPLVKAILRGHTKAGDLAAALEWSPRKVEAAREKLARRLEELGERK